VLLKSDLDVQHTHLYTLAAKFFLTVLLKYLSHKILELTHGLAKQK